MNSLIIFWFGKLTLIRFNPKPPDYLLAVPPERGTTNRRLAWILTGYRTNLGYLDFAHRSDLSFSLLHGDIGDRRPVPTAFLIVKGVSVLVTNNHLP